MRERDSVVAENFVPSGILWKPPAAWCQGRRLCRNSWGNDPFGPGIAIAANCNDSMFQLTCFQLILSIFNLSILDEDLLSCQCKHLLSERLRLSA